MLENVNKEDISGTLLENSCCSVKSKIGMKMGL
jgi:hypothetical protein